MEDSHFNSSYFWAPVPTMPGQIENAMFLNKVKEQQEKNASFPPSSASHYQTALLTIPTPGAKTDGGGPPSSTTHVHSSHGTQNITVLPVSSASIMAAAGLVITTPQGTLVSPTSSQSFVSGHPATTMIVSALQSPDKKGDGSSHVVVMPTPSKRGRKRKTTMVSRVGPVGGPGSETIILTQLTPGGQVTSLQHHNGEPYELSNEEEDHGPKDTTKTYRSHTESKPHKCPHCTKSFANSSYLAQHTRIHTGVKPYSCVYCEKCFRQLSHLQQHSRIHTGDRPYKCTQPGCEKSFTQLSNLQSHRRQHNKDKPYKCPNCNKGYIDSASLEVHMSTHTVKHARIYSCSLCSRTYTSVRQMSISEEHFYMKHYESQHWHQTPGRYFTPCSHVTTVSPLHFLPSSQETYLVKHMEKHNPDQLTAPAVMAAQPAHRSQSQAQGQAEAQGRVGSADGGSSRPGRAGSGAAGGGQQGQNQSSYPQTETTPCPFDLHQFKTVSAGDIHYKPVTVADLTSHKDLFLTVSTSTIQVEHLNS
uniref:Zinc finger protein 384 n=1 Tax=Nothobranchius pienaari TaxID=704102 RepID=A0A1A8LW20_9TELE